MELDCPHPLFKQRKNNMAFEGNTGLQVATQYGARDTGNTIGVEHSQDGRHQLSVELTAKGLIEGFTAPIVLPKGAIIEKAHVYVDQAFTGLTNVSIGVGGAEATNGITLLAADLAVGGKDVTSKLTGTWVAGTATTVATNVRVAKTGTPTGGVGRASVVITYLYKRRNDTEFKATVGFPTYKAQPQV